MDVLTDRTSVQETHPQEVASTDYLPISQSDLIVVEWVTVDSLLT